MSSDDRTECRKTFRSACIIRHTIAIIYMKSDKHKFESYHSVPEWT